MSCTLGNGFASAGMLSEIFSDKKDLFSPEIKTNSEHEKWMLEAFRASHKSAGHSSPNPSVGCVFVKDGRIVATGHTQSYGGDHAEVKAIKSLSDKHALKGSTAYVTLEPCSHQGKTPPCVNALIEAKISECFIAMADPNPLVSGKGITQLQEAGIKVTVGVLQIPIEQWHRPFISGIKSKKIYTALKWAQTLDGCLCDTAEKSQWISNPTSQIYTHWLRQYYDAILVSAKTFLNDKAQLTVRQLPSWVSARNPTKIILDLNNRIPSFEGLPASNAKIIHIISSDTPAHKSNGQCLTITLAKQNANLQTALDALTSQLTTSFLGKPLQSLLVEPGPTLLAAFLDQGLFDIAHCLVSPSLLGNKAKSLASLLSPRAIEQIRRYDVISRTNIDTDTLIEFTPQ